MLKKFPSCKQTFVPVCVCSNLLVVEQQATGQADKQQLKPVITI